MNLSKVWKLNMCRMADLWLLINECQNVWNYVRRKPFMDGSYHRTTGKECFCLILFLFSKNTSHTWFMCDLQSVMLKHLTFCFTTFPYYSGYFQLISNTLFIYKFLSSNKIYYPELGMKSFKNVAVIWNNNNKTKHNLFNNLLRMQRKSK